MSVFIGAKTSVRLLVGLAAVTASTSAFAGRYWQGSNTLFSNTSNWGTGSGSGAPASVPGTSGESNSEGTTYFYGYKNGVCNIDGAFTLYDKLCVATDSTSYFNWNASPLSGITATGKNFRLGADSGRSPTYLRITGGTYSFGSTYIGHQNGVKCGLEFNGDSFTVTKLGIAAADGVSEDATLTINSGTFQTTTTDNDDTFQICGNGKTNTTGTLIINDTGKLSIPGGGYLCNVSDSTGTIILNGGTLDMTGTLKVGGYNQINANIYVNTGAVWNVKGFRLGGRGDKTKYNVTNAVTRLEVNGGTINMGSQVSGIGYAVGEGCLAEMIINDGSVTITGTDAFYVGESGPGSFTMNGGTFTMTKTSCGFGFGHSANGYDVGTVTLNGGVLNIWKFRLDYLQAGSKLIFNGGTVVPTAAQANFLDANTKLECVVDEGGLIVDTAGFDITIAHPFTSASGKPIGGITKKGLGKLTLSQPFAGEITVLKGSVAANGNTYLPSNDTSNQNRYWLGATQDALASETANWAAESGGAGGASIPNEEFLGKVYFEGGYTYPETVFDTPVEVGATVYIGANAATPLTWSATDSTYGLKSSTTDWILGYDVDHATADLEIDSGTYSGNYFRMGYTSNAVANVFMNGGAMTVSKGRVAGGEENSDATLAISNGTFTASSSMLIVSGNYGYCDGTVVVDGGTLVTTGPDYVRIGENGTNSTALLHMKSGTWNTKSFLVGGPTKTTASDKPGLLATLLVDGGTINASANCSIGANVGEGCRSEMIINGGAVNINNDNLYVGDGGPGYLTINGGSLTMKDTSYGVAFGHKLGDGTGMGGDPGYVTLNGGTLTLPRFRLDYTAAGSMLVFNGTTVRATRNNENFLDADTNLTVVIQSGNMVIDTAGHNVIIAHDLTGPGGIVKKGLGTLYLTGNNTFEGGVRVEAGRVGDDPVTTDPADYTTKLTVTANNEDLGVVQLHRSPLSTWLTDPDLASYITVYDVKGTASNETPRYIAVGANGETNTYMNLKTGTTYNDTVGGMSYTFTTEDAAPRTLRIDYPTAGKYAKNVRDVGSWPLQSLAGKKMNQDVIFRGGNLDGMVDASAAQRSASYLTSIGLKSEIDLRRPSKDTDMATAYQELAADGTAASFAADGCAYYRFDLGWGDSDGTQIGADDGGNFTNRVQKMFSTLGTEGRLPAYFHCQIGTDRTGITGLLLLGLMGVEEEVLYRDYLMSNFASIGGSRSLEVPETFLRYILRGNCNSGKYVYTGNDDVFGVSVASRCRQYLAMCGVTEAEMNNITMALSGETLQEVLDRVNAYEEANNYRTVSYVPYEGSSTTNAMHRFGTNGMRILPRTDPTRSGYIFQGWDVDNETEFAEGQTVVYALWKSDAPEPTFRFWADGNSDHEEFQREASWDPAPKSMDSVSLDTFVLNKGFEKIAELSTNVTCSMVYVGWGTTDGSNRNADYDLGGHLDVTDGTLTATNGVWIGAEYSDRSNNVMNVTSGSGVYAKWLRMANGSSRSGAVCDTLNISGGATFETDGGENRLATYSGGAACMNITEGGSFTSSYRIYVGYSGKASLDVDGGSIELTNTGDEGSLYVGREGTSAIGSMHVTNGTVSVYALRIGQSANSRGEVTIDEGSTVNCSYYLYVGRKGYGTLTVNGGEINVGHTVRFSTNADGVPDCVINLNGGRIKTVDFSSGYVRGIINWNGGTITGMHNDEYDMSGVLFPAADAARFGIRVLAGNAIYESEENNDTAYQINVPMAGPGAFIKRGSGPLVINGTTDVRGGIRAEGGSLTFGTGALVGDPSKPMKELTVFKDSELDLGGASISVMKYVAYGVEQPVGTYTEHGGTITVLSASFYVPATAVWTNYLGDGDLDNPDNWTVKNAEGVELPGALPDASTAVYIPADASRPDVSGLTIESATLLVSGNVYLRGSCAVPAVAKEAACWFDFSDEKTITFREGSSTEIASIANKGTAASTLPSAVAYGNEPGPDGDGNPTYREPRLGSNELNGRTIMLQTDLDDDGGVLAKGFRTEALGLESNHDRTLVVVSRRGTSTPLWALGIETGDDSKGHFRIQHSETSVPYKFCAGNYDGTGALTGYGNHDIECGQDPAGWSVRMFEAENTNPDTGEVRVSTRTYSEEAGVTQNALTVRNLNTQADARLYMGYRRSTQSNGRGQIAEAMYFDRALTVAEQDALQSYLSVKWFTAADMSNIPRNIAIENNSTIDFGGGYWTFDTVTGTGTIGNANVVITGSIQPGLTVGGTVTFAENARFDMSPYEMGATGQQIVFLTAEKIENAPDKARGESRIAHLALVDNGDGTVSLVGVLQSAGFSFKLR